VNFFIVLFIFFNKIDLFIKKEKGAGLGPPITVPTQQKVKRPVASQPPLILRFYCSAHLPPVASQPSLL
jgi:hypothetical protein